MNPPKPKGFSTRPPLSYNPLDPKRRQIRLLTLHPGSWRARIRCSLTTVSLLDEPDYEALSYVWGDPQSTAPIFVDGCVFLATINLWRALRRLRRHYPRTIWIDAICINQSDDREKSSQVSMMKDVYESCRQGILWLGEDLLAKNSKAHPQPTSAVFRRGKQLLKILAQGKHFSEQPWSSTAFPESSEPAVCAKFHGHFASLQYLAELAWWRRIWVVQEAALPPHVFFLAGSENIPFKLVQDAWRTSARHVAECCSDYFFQPEHRRGKAFEPIRSFVTSCNIYTARLAQQSRKERSLQDLCSETGSYQSTKPHDRIYGLLGLVTSWKSTSPLVVDYKLPVVDCFVAAVLKMIEQDGNLSALNGKRSASRPRSLPSWIPDRLVAPVFGITKASTHFWSALDLCRASGTHFSMPRLFGSSALKMKALRVGIVEKVGNNMVGSKSFYWIMAFANWREIAGIKDPPCLEDLAIVEIFWTVIIKAIMTTAQMKRFYDCDEVPWRDFEETYQRDHVAWMKMRQEGVIYDQISQMADIYIRTTAQRAFVTTDGKIGLAHGEIEPHDEIYLPIGGNAPLILRRKAKFRSASKKSLRLLDLHSVVSECYVDGVMDGELVRGDWRERVEDIVLV